MNINSRLDTLFGLSGGRALPSQTPVVKDNLLELIDGEEVSNARGKFLRSYHTYSPHYHYGDYELGPAFELSEGWLAHIDRSLAGLDPSKLLFIDTETTGLTGGTGINAFMVGLGWLEDGRVQFEQLIMRSHSEEAAMLEHLYERLSGCSGVVTYNGKAFDMPLIVSRFIMKRMPMAARLAEALPNFDLLFVCRRLWSRFLPNCRLDSVERYILNAPRHDDLPGSQIPEVYSNYLLTGNGSQVARAGEHNERDILALMSLVNAVFGLLEHPFEVRRCVCEAGVGYYLRNTHRHIAEPMLARALAHTNRPKWKETLKITLATLTRSSDPQGSGRMWCELWDEGCHNVLVGEALAKILGASASRLWTGPESGAELICSAGSK